MQVAETLEIGGKHFRRLKFGDSVTMALGREFNGGVPSDLIDHGNKEAVGKLAFCFLDPISKSQFEYSVERFLREVIAPLTAEKITALTRQINDIVASESAEELRDAPKSEEMDGLKKKHIFFLTVMLAMSIYGTMSLLSTAYRAASPLMSGVDFPFLKNKQ